MKKNTAFYMVITMGVFLLAGQTYAMSGSMGDSKGHGSMTGDQKMTSPLPQTMGNSGQQGAMKGGAGQRHESTHGTMPQGMMQGGAEGGNGRQQGRMHGAGSDETTQPPATSTTE